LTTDGRTRFTALTTGVMRGLFGLGSAPTTNVAETNINPNAARRCIVMGVRSLLAKPIDRR
jgi:hypothetical protein